MAKIGVIHGPNLNLLGTREVSIYGSATLEEINRDIATAAGASHEVKAFQSNSEGAIVDKFHKWRDWADGIIINPGAYTHTSVAIRDAISAMAIPVVEAHLSNIHAREEFRKTSLLAPVCLGQISGFGALSYRLALEALLSYLQAETK